MAKRGENIWHRKDGRWEARYVRGREGNRAIYGYVYARSYGAAKEKQQRAQQGENSANNETHVTFRTLTEAFLCQKKHSVKASTLACYRGRVSAYLLPYFAGQAPCTVDALAIDRYTDTLFTEKGLAPKTVRDIVGLLGTILDFGTRTGLLSAKVERTLPKVPKKEIRVLSPDEQERLTCCLLSHTDRSKAGVLLALLTGLRIGEVCALRRRDLRLAERRVRVGATVQRVRLEGDADSGKVTRVMVASPKSESSVREIPLPGTLADFLADFCVFMREEDYFLTGTACCLEPRQFYRKYRKYLAECGLAERGCTFHTLRHTFATEAIRHGFDVKSLSEILGHASVKMTLERYVHPSFEQKQQQMERLMMCHPLQSLLQSEDKKGK